MKIKELKVGTIGTVECVITEIEEKSTKSNGVFLNISISDGESQAIGKKWNKSVADFEFQVGQVVFMEMKAEEYKGNITFVVRDIVESSSDQSNFICGAPIESEQMFSFLMKTAAKCGVYAPAVTKMLRDVKDRLLKWGAAHSNHHNIYGGLLYHSYRMTKIAAYIANVYNKEPGMVSGIRVVNTELLVAGTILHDIGKIWELDTNALGVSEYTPQGVLMGHLYIGAEMFGKYAQQENLSDEDIMLMKHLILAHHGKFEYGAVAIPAIPEAMILHQVDMIDSRIYQFEVNADTVEPGEMTPRVFGLEQNVYRPTWRVAPEKD